MRIRSQNKLVFIENPSISIESPFGECMLVAFLGHEGEWILGRYPTKERCIEILDQIQSYADNQDVKTFIMPEE